MITRGQICDENMSNFPISYFYFSVQRRSSAEGENDGWAVEHLRREEKVWNGHLKEEVSESSW